MALTKVGVLRPVPVRLAIVPDGMNAQFRASNVGERVVQQDPLPALSDALIPSCAPGVTW